MSVKMESRKLADELRRSGASVSVKTDHVYKNFVNPKPTAEGEYYRFRLLWFSDDTSDRKTPFVEKYSHIVYERDGNDVSEVFVLFESGRATYSLHR